MTTENRVTLKNVKHAKFSSEETECFEATVYFDGKRVGVCGNDGHGGCNRWSFERPLDQGGAAYTALRDYAASLPAEVISTSGADHAESFLMQPDADSLVDDALQDWLTDKEIKRQTAKHLVFIHKDSGLSKYGPFNAADMAKALADLATTEKLVGAVPGTIINGQSAEAARAIYNRRG